MFRHAIVRKPGENFSQGLTSANVGTPDFELALAQHEAYCQALESCGVEVICLPPDVVHPDSTFVEDTAILTSKSAILTRPGAPSRRGEVASVRDAVCQFYPTVHEIWPPGTLDGGDVCQAGSHFFAGISERTNDKGARQLADFLSADGFTCSTVEIRGMRSILHLKSGIAYLGDNILVVTEELAGREEFASYDCVVVSRAETYGCNCVQVNDYVLMAAGFDRLRSELERRKFRLIALEMSEFRTMDGGLSCLSLRF